MNCAPSPATIAELVLINKEQSAPWTLPQPVAPTCKPLRSEWAYSLAHPRDRELAIPFENQVQTLDDQIRLVLIGVERYLGELLSHGGIDPYADGDLADAGSLNDAAGLGAGKCGLWSCNQGRGGSTLNPFLALEALHRRDEVHRLLAHIVASVALVRFPTPPLAISPASSLSRLLTVALTHLSNASTSSAALPLGS